MSAPVQAFTRWAGFANVLILILFQQVLFVAGLLRPGYWWASQRPSTGPAGGERDPTGGVRILPRRGWAWLRRRRRLPEATSIRWVVGGACAYLGSILGFLLAGLLLRGDPAWRRWGTYSLLASVAPVVLVAVTFYTFSPGTPPEMRVGGLMEVD